MALWRIRYYSGLSLLALLGVIIAVGLVTSASFFSQAVDQVMLNRELAEYTRITQRPAFAARVFAPSSQSVPFDLTRVETLTGDVADTVSSEVGLPIKRVIMLADSGTMHLLPPANDTRYDAKRPLADGAFIYMTGIAENITNPEGAPFVDDAPAGQELSVWLHKDLGEQLGVQMGDHYVLTNDAGTATIPFVIAGLAPLLGFVGLLLFWGETDEEKQTAIDVGENAAGDHQAALPAAATEKIFVPSGISPGNRPS